MRSIRGGKGGWLAGVSMMLALGSCTSTDQGTPADSAAGTMPMAAPVRTATDYGHCGEPNGIDCQGGLLGLGPGWQGNGQIGQVLHDTVAPRFVRTFIDASQVAVQRKSRTGAIIWTRVDAIDDAHKVFLGEIQYPVVMARFEGIRGNGQDFRYGITRNPQKTFYFVVNPDSWDGDTDATSYWAVIEYARNTRQATIVASGPRFRACQNSDGKNHPQKAAAFAWFVSCPMANMSFETVIAWRGLMAADSIKGLAFLDSLPPNLRAAFRLASENDDPLWITCGLGCCSTVD